MANLARYGHVPPDVFDEMLEEDTLPLAREIETLRRRDQEFTLELAKFVAQASMRSGI